MRLCIGLLAPSPQWEQLLLQEGVEWSRADLLMEGVDSAFSAVVVNRLPSRDEAEAIRGYLRRGGGILGSAKHLSGIGVRHRPAAIQYVVGERNSRLPLSLLDAAAEGAIAVEANMMRTQNNEFALFAGELGGGVAVILPFEIDQLMSDERSIVKNFYATPERLPAEHVSLVSKGEVRQLVVQSLRYLHHVRSIPYVHLWYFPEGRRNVFSFRIDTDAGSREDVDNLYTLARSHDVGMSWFLDVQSHEAWLHHFSSMRGQEMGVHCFDHKVFPQAEMNEANLQKAKKLMLAAGMAPVGLAMPFGIWNQSIGGTIENMGVSYSSEFSFAYDTMPLYPVISDHVMKTLQIPIHPVCIGSLRKIGYSAKMMHEYFAMKVAEKLASSEPLFFYHHPSDQNVGVVESLFERMHSEGIQNMTFGAYTTWWKTRESFLPRFEVKGDMIEIVSKERAGSVFVRVLRNGKEAIVPVSPSLDITKLDWREMLIPDFPNDIRRIREFDTRALVAKLYTKFQRKFR